RLAPGKIAAIPFDYGRLGPFARPNDSVCKPRLCRIGKRHQTPRRIEQERLRHARQGKRLTNGAAAIEPHREEDAPGTDDVIDGVPITFDSNAHDPDFVRADLALE